jgi:hypothetical protein
VVALRITHYPFMNWTVLPIRTKALHPLLFRFMVFTNQELCGIQIPGSV